MTKPFAIVTNSYQRDQKLVERSLRASLAQDPKPRHVIFIDQNKPAFKLSSDIAENPILIHLPSGAQSVSIARNSFSIPKDVDWLIFCDDDGYPAPDYTQQFVKLLQQYPELVIMAGSIVRDDNGEYYTPRHKIGGSLRNFRHTKLLMGSNFACTVQTFKKLGGFDEKFGAGSYWGSGEETDFAWNAYFNQIPMEYFPQLVVYHIKPYAGDFSHSMKKAFHYGRGKGALVGKWMITNHKPIVALELFEMLAVPLLQAAMSLLLFRFQMFRVYLSSLRGRIYGLWRYLIESRQNSAQIK